MSIKRIFSTLFLVTALTLSSVSAALAAPPIASSFWGTVTLDGESVPAGTLISVRIFHGEEVLEEVLIEPILEPMPVIINTGTSWYSFPVLGDDPETTEKIEGGVEGYKVVFYIDNHVTDQIAIWHTGTSVRLDLTATTDRTVTFDSNGGAGEMDPQTANTPTTLTLNTFTHEGYSFNEWNTADDGDGTVYADGETYDFSVDLTLYAQWAVNAYSVTFDSQGGSPVSGQSVDYDSMIIEPLDPTYDGYTFNGWFDAATGGTKWTFDVDPMPARNLILYAQWSQITHTVTFDLGDHSTLTGGELVQTVAHGADAVAPIFDVDTGWNFTGWDVAFTNVTDDLSVTAEYSQITHIVTFDLGDHGTLTSGELIQTVVHGADAVAPLFDVDAGWSFTGWDVNFTNVTDDLTVTANFADITSPVLTITGATADDEAMTGDLETGYILETTNLPSEDHLIQFAAGTTTDEPLADEYFGLYLTASTVDPAVLKTYYADRGTPEPYLSYLEDAADGVNPFVYIDGTTVLLVDAAKHDLASTDVPMTIPDDYPLGTYTVEGAITDLAGNPTTVTLVLIVSGDRTSPAITVLGATADAEPMAGDLETGYILEVKNYPAVDHLVQFAAGTTTDEPLAAEYFGLYLTDSTVDPAVLKTYYADRGTPEPYLSYLEDAADGVNPFVYIDGTTVLLADAAKHDLAAVDVPMTIPDDYPLGTYTVEGVITDLAGNDTPVTLIIVIIPSTDTFTLEYVAGTGGTVSGNASQVVVFGSDGTEVTAVPDTGYHFISWSDGALTAARTDTNVMADLNVTANFAIDTFTLEYAAGTGGTLAGNTSQTVNYDEDGTEVTALPDAGYHFVNWSDGVLTAARIDTNVMTDMNVTANFAQDEYTLTVNIEGNGTVTPDIVAPYHLNDVVVLTAVADEGWTFAGWSGACTGSGTCTVTLDAAKTVTATFTQNEYILTIVSVNGTVAKEPNKSTYHEGDVVTLTATANAGWGFDSWAGDLISSENPDAITVHGDATVTATYTVVSVAPSFTSTPVTSVDEDAIYIYNITVTDPNVDDTLSISAPTKPNWLIFTDNGDGTATLTGTPTNSEVGIHDVNLRVNDGSADVDQSFTIDVANTNDAPSFSSEAVTGVDEDATYAYDIATTDPDVGDTLTISAPTKPDWLTFTDNGDGTATLTGTPTNSEVGIHDVTLRVNDGTVDVYQIFTIDVGNTNDGPSFTSEAVTSVDEDALYSYNITATDTDAGDTLTISAPTKPDWLTFTDNGDGTATLVGTPTNDEVGDHDVVLQVSDSVEMASQPFAISVANTNDAPVLDQPADQSNTKGDVVSFQISATEIDLGDMLTYSASGLPESLSIAPSSGLITGTLTDDADTYNVTVTVDDGNGGTDSKLFDWVVAEPIYTLVVNKVGSGTVTPDKVAPYYLNDVVELTAVADEGWTFSGWAGAGCSGTDPCSITMDGDKTVTATFTQNEYILTVDIVGNGTVTPDIAAPYYLNDVVVLTAVADEGWIFSGWTGAGCSGTDPCSVTMDAAKTVTAEFAKLPPTCYALTIEHTGQGSDPVATPLHSADCSEGEYAVGENIAFSDAVPDIGWHISSWTGTDNDLSTADNNSMTMPNGVHSIKVNYVENPVVSTWYLAEGYTGAGFGTYILVQNPNNVPTQVDVTYMLQDGSLITRDVIVAANARETIITQDAGQVGLGQAFSTKLEADQPIIVERAMYWPNGDGTVGGHDTTGIQQPETDWYLAEGYTGSGFETFILIQNPNGVATDVDVTYMVQGGSNIARTITVPANSRYTILTNDVAQVGPDQAFSTKLVADQPIIVERAMYFNNDGHAAGGVTSPITTWYLSEGYTGAGYETFILLQNPSDTETDVDITYMLADGSQISRTVTVPANARYTVVTQDAAQVGTDQAFSTVLVADQPIIVERAMYWPNGDGSVGGHATTGVRQTASTWYLAEGYTGGGFNTFILIQNPNSAATDVDVTYMVQGGSNVTRTVTIPANSRFTILANDVAQAGPDLAFSTKLVAATQTIIVERAMYFGNGGHVAAGVALAP